MSAEAKALLDELMGRARNLDPTQNHPDMTWESDDVCKYFLCGFCPNELFTNTRADLGPCNKIHDDAFRKDYQRSTRYEKCGYEEDFIRFLQTLISDVEKRIRRGHQRLALNTQTNNVNGNTTNVNEDKIKLLTERINVMVEQAETLGCEGKVEEAQDVMKLADQLKEERTQVENQPAVEETPMIKQMEVCDVCGAFLIVGDAPQRQDEHLMGKQHAGYAQVRAELDKRKKKARDAIEAREATEVKLRQEREEREKERQRERDERRQRERERERDRDRRRRSRSRSRDRHRSSRGSPGRDRKRNRRSRSRSKDRRRRSRSGSKNRRSRRSSSRDKKSSRRERRSRSRHRSRSRERKDKSSRDKDRDHRDRDRDSRRGNTDKEDRRGRNEDTEKHKQNADYRPTENGLSQAFEGGESGVTALEDMSEAQSNEPTENGDAKASDMVVEGSSYGMMQSEGDSKIGD